MKKFIAKCMLGVLTFSLMSNSLMANNIVMAAELNEDTISDSNYVVEEADAEEEYYANLKYTVHCQTYGWLDYVSEGEVSGTEGQAKRLEGIIIDLDTNLEGSIEYQVHCQTYSWMDPVTEGVMAGTERQSKRLESIRIKLTGELANYYDVVYRVHCQTYGWTDWVSNGADAGTTGQSKRLEAIQIKLVDKNDDKNASLKYSTHCQSYGWLPPVSEGEMSGTERQSKRLEAIKIDVAESDYAGGIAYKVHCQTYGWMDWKYNNNISGTSGQSKRLEAIQIMLTGELAAAYDVYYRVHSQTFGWLDWAMNGQVAGTSGLSKRLEGIEIVLVDKGGEAPGDTERPYVYQALLDADTQPEEDDIEYPDTMTPVVPGVPTTSTRVEDILNSSQLYAPISTGDSEIDARVKTILSQIITDDMTTYEKTLAIYNWILNNTYYQEDPGYYRGSYISIYDTWCVSQSYSVLCKGYGSCVNYASAFVVLTRAIGLESYKVYGAIYTGNFNRNHAWAVVNINGTLYTFDPQIADAVEESGWGGKMDYFCKSDEDSSVKNYYINVDDEGLTRADYIEGFNYFKQY